ncbi:MULTISPECIES: LamG-like jellyroll fold domain-containing protein [Nonomuraea]|uniref:Ig-like domain-containing protein n=1 Tax=Nonomuraea ferruginea TaxID=46174 RepID=A0ABT4SZ70_9ACTN|nr:LamG-like jellyroll fold domain-containing protein [Nonomuraea ferruginea]MDA0642563.1 Ig-like domain-containing protein [Nonomuraea ferruginea]
MSAPAIAQVPTPPPTGTPTPTPKTPPTAPDTPTSKALAQAKKDNRRIEIESLRSENATYYANPDGKTLRMEQHQHPIRVKNAKGDGLTPVDTTLVEADGVIKPKAVKGELTLSAGDDAFVLKSKGSKGSATIGSPGKLPKPTIDGSTATYPSVYGNGIDLVVTATAAGFKQEIVLRERINAPVSFRIPATVPKNMALDKDTAGRPALLSQGKKIADLPPALLLDSVAADLDSDIDAGKVGQATVTLDEGASALVYTPDPAYLADPAVAYPVTLAAFDDDWWEPELGNDTFVNNADYPNGYANSGLDRILVGKSNDGAVRWRSYIRFDEFPADHPIRGATVQNADLVLWNHLSSDCGEFVGSGITAYQVTERWDVSTLTWSSQPRITTTGADTEYAGYAGENCSGAMSYPWDLIHSVDDIVQAWADGEPNYGFQLTAGNESDLRNWRRYRTNEAGGCTTTPRQDCLGTLHPPILTVDFEPPPMETEAVYYSYEGPELTEPPTYEEAVAMRAQTHPDGPNPSPVTYEELQTLGENRSSVPTYVNADHLPDDNPQPEPDTTAPRLGTTTPPSDATDVPTNVQIAAHFTEVVSDAAITVEDAHGVAVAGNASMNSENVKLTFSANTPLAAGSVYTVEVTDAKDRTGNVMTPYTWSFTTGGGTDISLPTVTGTVPARDAVDVPAETTVRVTFSEAVTDVQLTVRDSTNTPVQGTVIPLNNYAEWLFTPNSDLIAETTYQIDVSNAKDATGTSMAPYIWSFTTGAGAPPPTPGLVAAYGMNEGSGISVADSSSQNNNGTGSSTSWANGKFGKALSFNGTSSWVTVQDAASLRLTTGMTLSAWVNPSTVADWSSVVGKELDEGLSYTLYAATDFSAPGGWVQTSPDDSSYVDALTPLPVNTWSHLALTYDNTVLRLFVDGQQVDETPLSGSLFDDGSPLRIGGNAAYSEYFSGLIDEVRVYNRAQSTAEIQADMNTPVGSTTPDPDPTPTPTPTPDPTPDPVPGLVAAYGMEDGSGTTVGDSSGYDNTGAARDTTWATGKHGKALSFNGSSSWVTVQHAASLRLRNALTLSAWVRPSALDGWRTVLLKEHSWGGSYGLYASTGTGPAGWLETDDDAGGSASSNLLPLNQWSHLAVTYNGNAVRLYVNGTQVSQAPLTGELIDDGGRLRIGGNAALGEFYRGLIDEVRVYNRAQTATEIQTDMNIPIGAAAASTAAQRLRQSLAPQIQKLVVDDGQRVDGVTFTSDLTPNLTAWLRAGRDGEAKVEVEVAGKPTKSVKAGKGGKATTDKRLIWSGEVTAKPDDTRISLQVPKGKLRDGEKVRWRARVITGDAHGAWSTWYSLTVSKSQQEGETRKATAPAASSEPPEFSVGHLTAEECEGDRGPGGVYIWKNVYLPFTWCYTHWYGVTLYAMVWDVALQKYVKAPVGWVQFRGSTVINTRIGRQNNDQAWDDPNRKSRDIDVWFKINHMRKTGVTQTATIRTYVKLAGSPSGSQCQPITGTGRQASLPEWEGDKYAQFIIRSNKGNIGPNFLGTCTISPYIEVATPLGDEDFDQFRDPVRIACDTERANFNYEGGCIFQEANRILQYETTSLAHGPVARHIKDAFYNPTAPGTAPVKSDKVVPGNYVAPRGSGQGLPLHRTTDAGLRAETTTQRQKGCNTLTFFVLHECDEYPFNSTWEGGGRKWKMRQPLSDNYSVRYVYHSPNEAAGTRLTWFYWRYRIMDGSPFWVMITTNDNAVYK